jgi:hypothetical protein
LSKTSQDLSPEAQASVAGLIQKREKLISEMSQLDPTQVDSYKQQVDSINEQIKNITNTGNPFEFELNQVGQRLSEAKLPEPSKELEDIENNRKLDLQELKDKGLESREYEKQAKEIDDYYNNLKQQYDTENITGLPSEVGGGEEPIQAEPIQGGGTQEIGSGGILQENVPSGEGEVGKIAQGESVTPTKENVTERLNINNPFYIKISKALSDLGLIKEYNPETKEGDVVGGYVQSDSKGGFAAGDVYFKEDGSISYIKGDVIVEFDKNGDVISENTKEATENKRKIEIEGKKESIASLKKTKDSEDFKYKTVTETDAIGNKKKVRRLKTEQELKESTDKINDAISKAESELKDLGEEAEAPVPSEMAQGEVKPIKIDEFAKNLNESAGILKTPDGKKASNYVSKEGVEVTLTEDEDGGYVNGNQVQGDIMLDFIGNDTKRGEGLASKELDRIIAEADKNNMSISLIVDSEQAIKGTESKKGLSNQELKKWYESKGFIFDKNSRFGYRPKSTENASIYKKPDYIAKEGEVTKDNIEYHSSPQDLQEAFDQDRLKEGTFHEDGDGSIFKIEDGKIKEVKNVTYVPYENNKFVDKLVYSEAPVPSEMKQGEVKPIILKLGESIIPTNILGSEDVFHASHSKRKGRLKEGSAEGFGQGVYFGTNKEGVQADMGENLTEAKLNLSNPVYTSSKEWSEVEQKAVDNYNRDYTKKHIDDFNEDQFNEQGYVDRYKSIDDIPDSKYISDAAKELGYDAIIDVNESQYGNEILVLDESKIIYPEDIAEGLPVPTEAKAEAPIQGVEQEVTIKEMKPFTDRMVEIEREFKNNEYEIDTDYDNEIQVLDKNGEQVEPVELPDNLKKLAADYEKATSKLGEFDASAREKALAESRKVVEAEAEVVEPKKEELPPVQEKPQEPIVKVEKPTINKDNKEDKPFITKNKKHKVEIKGGVAIVTDIEGNRVPSRIYKKALREYAKNFDYSVGKTADESGQEISSIDDVIDATENPIQLAEIYANEEPATANLSPAEAMIQDYGIGKVTNKSFRRYNDVNNITMSLAKSYLSKEGRGLDQIAKDISEHFFPDGNGTEISPEDVADFMVRFPNREAGRLMESDIAKKASDKFQKLTGLYLNREIADVAVNQEFELLNKQQQKLLENEYKDQSELEKDYWSAYAKTDGFTKEIPVSEAKQAKARREKVGKFEAKAQAIADKIMATELPDWFSISDKDVTTKGVDAESMKKALADAVVNMGKLLDRGVEFSEALKEAVKDLVNVKGEDNRESIEKGFEQYYKAQVPLEENPFESIPKTQVARDKYFDTTFGENADKAREIYSQGGTAKEMLAKMQEEERIVAEEKKEDATWTSIRQEKLKEIEKVKNLFEKEKKTTWSKIQQDAFEGVAKEYPNKTLNEAIRAKVENIAAKYDAGQDYNPTAKDLAIIQEFKRQTESKIEQSKEGLESDNEIDRLSAMAELENYENDLLNVGKASFKREAGTAFGYRQSETKMDENYGLQIRRMRLMKANGGEKLSPADMDWTKNQWEKEKEIMKKEQEINERQLKESFDKKIAELEDKYKNKEKLKTVINKSLKQKTLSQSGKEVANIIRNLKLKGTKLDFTLGTWNIAIEGVARLVEAGSTVAEAIESLIRNGEISFATENDKDMFENEVTARIINLGNRDKSLNKIREIANDTGSTIISNEMVSKGFIKDFVNSFIGEVDKSEVLNEATRELKTILPDIGKKDLRKAFLKQDEYKQPTKKTLEESLAQAKRDLLRAERKESKKESTEDELQARKLQDEKDKIQTNIKQLKRRIEDEEYEKEEPITLSKKDAELIQLEKQKNEIEAEFRKKQKEYFEKNKSKAERIADFIRSTYVAALIGAPTTMAKVAYMSAIRPTSEAVRRITLGKVFDAIFPSISKSAEKGGESSSLKSIRKGFEAYFMQMGERKMQEKFVKSSEAYDKASKAYYDALATGADKNKIDYLKKDMDNKLLSATGNIMYQFIGGSSIKDAFGALVNRANEIEKQFGKTEIESIKDGNLLDKTNYILGFIGRSHSAAKTFSGRFSYAASFMSRLEGAARDGSISNPNRIIEIAHESYIDWERGKYQQDNWVTKKWNDVLKSINEKTAGKGEWSKYDKALSALLKTDVAITRVPVNIIHEAVSEYTLGALRAPWLAYKEYAKAKKIAIDEGYDKAIDSKQFSDRIKEIVSNIDPEYSAKIYRLFTKGGLGAGLYGLAIATGLLKFGVFPHKGQKKKKEEEYLQEGELNPGQIMFGNDRLGETASKLIEHTPALWTTFMGLGISRIYADDVKSGKTTPQAAWDAAFTHAEIIESSVPQTKIVSPLGIIKQTGKSFMGKLSTYGMFDNYIDGKGAFVNQEKKELEIKTPEISRLKEYKVAPPSLGTRSQNKIDADDKHPKVGLLKDGKPYAYMNDIEWNKFNEYRKDYVSKALKELYVAADTKEIQLNRENLTDALATITKQATRIAKLKLIDEGLLPASEQDKNENQETISDIIKEIQKESTP